MILITGATGFLGTAMLMRLASENFLVRTAVRDKNDKLNIEQVIIPRIDASTDWSKSLASIDAVVHLAAHVHVMKAGVEDERKFHEVNVEGTRRLAEAAAGTGVKRFIFMSTVKVQGERTHGVPFTEAMPLAPEDAYSRSKTKAESVLKQIGQASGMEIVILRPPLVYGPGVKANFLQLMNLVQRGIPLPLGALNNARSLVYLDNLVDAIVTCLTHPAAANETFLVSDGKDLSTADLVRLLAGAMGAQVFLPPVPPGLLRLGGKLLGRGDMIGRITDSLQIDSSRIRKQLGWIPPVTPEEGLRRTVQWFLGQQRSASVP